MYRVTKAGRNYIHKFIPYIIQYRWWKTYVINVLFVGNISEVSLIFVYAHWFKINIILNTSICNTRWSQEDRMLFNFCLFICYPFKRTMDIVIEKYLFSCIQRTCVNRQSRMREHEGQCLFFWESHIRRK